jgi:AcrR family transcriptional regulator
MKRPTTAQTDKQEASDNKPRRKRADGLRKMDSLLQAAMEVFAKSGVDAPVREIAERAGVGLGTVYRHFPQRSDLIVAVFKSQMDACADAASVIASKYEPGEALARWMQRYVDFIATKRGLAAALHSGDPAYSALPGYFDKRLRPALRTLLDAAVRAKVVRPAIEADDLLRAVATYATELTAKSPHMRERWWNCWWMACVTERERKSTRPESDGDEPARSRSTGSSGKEIT